MNTQPITKTEIKIEGVTYRITGPMILSGNLRPMAAIQVQLFSDKLHSTTELTVDEYLTQQFELEAGDRSRVFRTLKVKWEGDKEPVSWVDWEYQRHGKHLSIYLKGPCSTYGTINAEKI